MPTPLQQSTHELLVLATATRMITQRSWQRKRLVRTLYDYAIETSAEVTEATTAASRQEFLHHLQRSNACVRRFKIVLNALSDLSVIDADELLSLYDKTEEVQRLVLQSLRTARTNNNAAQLNERGARY